MLCNHVSQLTGLREKVYTTNSHAEIELKENIRKEILEVRQEEQLLVNSKPFTRYIECVRVQEHHFQRLLYKGTLLLWSDS
jgi:hypothetical protein